MLTDALAQFLAFKRWPKLFLIVGPKPGDQLYAEAMRRSAKKFGLKIAAEKPWTFGPLARARGDSITQSDALVFTRGLDYDIMVVADEAADFGDYISYRTWDPRLVAGTQGLVADLLAPGAGRLGLGPAAEPLLQGGAGGRCARPTIRPGRRPCHRRGGDAGEERRPAGGHRLSCSATSSSSPPSRACR